MLGPFRPALESHKRISMRQSCVDDQLGGQHGRWGPHRPFSLLPSQNFVVLSKTVREDSNKEATSVVWRCSAVGTQQHYALKGTLLKYLRPYDRITVR